jgi:uncharacterized protein
MSLAAMPPNCTMNGCLGPRKVRSIETVWIPMRDGVKIAALILLPEDADTSPVPALVEYQPYRRRDAARLYYEVNHIFLASHGYACVRPDIRGSGDSEGTVLDEYVTQEQDDGVEIIAWLARQAWCTGKVGMFGNSWSGFSALQVAARRPPALKAIITTCSTDDRYTDDAHYTGGCINEGMFVWGSAWTSFTPRPPDPDIVGPGWREMWRERLESLDFYVGNWLSHPHRDAFWKHGSISEDHGQVACPVYLVGGWSDPYAATIPRMLEKLQVPRKGLCGPWNHGDPNLAWLGPTVDWLNEALRWWNHWLKGIDTGIMNEPMYRVWMQQEPPFSGATNVPGRWVAEPCVPSPRVEISRFYLTPAGLQRQPGGPAVMVLDPLQTVGATAPYYYITSAVDLPSDQRIDDARSLVFDTSPLSEPTEILGAAVVEVELSVDRPVAFLIVRLCEVTSDNVSRRVTYGVLNLCHRDGSDKPKALVPGARYRIRVTMRDIAQAFRAGSKLRLALSTTYWPMLLPSPEAVTLTVYTDKSVLEVPVRPPRKEDAELSDLGVGFAPASSGAMDLIPPRERSKTFHWDSAKRTLTIDTEYPVRRRRLNATGTELFESRREVSVIRDDDPTSASLEYRQTQGLCKPGWDIRVDTSLRLTLTRELFHLEGEVRVFDEGEEFWARKWQRPIKRQFV